jgi:FdhE protein
MCSARWRYPRLKCPFCGNEDQNTLKVLFPGDTTSAYRADVCEKCKRYIKVVDLRKTQSKTISEIEDWATIEIDLLAEREGFACDTKISSE